MNERETETDRQTERERETETETETDREFRLLTAVAATTNQELLCAELYVFSLFVLPMTASSYNP